MEGQTVVTSDDHNLGTVIAERDDCVIVETGHVFKAKHAIPRAFLHDEGGELHATITKDVITDSPKVDLETWDSAAVRLHYGLDGPFEVDPDPDGVNNAEVEGIAHGVTPAPAQRIATQESQGDLAAETPVIRDRMANAADPGGVTANLDNENRTGGADR
jgi:hypothetical protein